MCGLVESANEGEACRDVLKEYLDTSYIGLENTRMKSRETF